MAVGGEQPWEQRDEPGFAAPLYTGLLADTIRRWERRRIPLPLSVHMSGPRLAGLGTLGPNYRNKQRCPRP
jgi:hypothetical protein